MSNKVSACAGRAGAVSATAPIGKSVGCSGGRRGVAGLVTLSCVTLIVGVVSLVIASLLSAGLSSGWWQGGVATVQQIRFLAITLFVSGGVSFIGGIVGLALARQRRNKIDPALLHQLDTHLLDRTWSYVLQKDGKYALVVKHPARRQVEIKQQNLLQQEIDSVDQTLQRELQGYSRAYFCPTVQLPSSFPSSILNSTHGIGVVQSTDGSVTQKETQLDEAQLEKLDEWLDEGEWTYVRQDDGKYTLVLKHPPETSSGKCRMEERLHDLPIEALMNVAREIQSSFGDYCYRNTSPDRPESILIDCNKLATVLEVGAYTFVPQVNGKYSLVAHHAPLPNSDQVLMQVIEQEVTRDQWGEAGQRFQERTDYRFIEIPPPL